MRNKSLAASRPCEQTAARLFQTSRPQSDSALAFSVFAKAAGRAGAFLTEKWNTAVQTIPLSGDTKASFLPQQYDIHLCFLSLPLH